MTERAPLTEAELDAVAERLLDKMLKRLAKVAAPPANEQPKPVAVEPTLEDYAALRARRRRQGKR